MKKIISLIMVCSMLICSSVGVSAASGELPSQMTTDEAVRLQSASLIQAVDMEKLMADAKNNVIDAAVPVEIRESVVADLQFTPAVGVSADALTLSTDYTVQRVGNIVVDDEDVGTMYVTMAVGSTDEKVDDGFSMKNGVKAWAYVYWIDHYGTENELVAAGAWWEPGEVVVSNRQVRWGTTDIFWLLWLNGPTVRYPTQNNAYYDDVRYTGFVLRCETRITIVNIGTLTCNVASRIVT